MDIIVNDVGDRVILVFVVYFGKDKVGIVILKK